MQDLANAGKSVLPSTVPDSGTGARGLMDLVVLSMMGEGAHAAHLLSPEVLGAGAALAAPYTGWGLNASRAVLSGQRPALMREIGATIARGRPAVRAAGGALVPMAGRKLLPAPPQ